MIDRPSVKTRLTQVPLRSMTASVSDHICCVFGLCLDFIHDHNQQFLFVLTMDFNHCSIVLHHGCCVVRGDGMRENRSVADVRQNKFGRIYSPPTTVHCDTISIPARDRVYVFVECDTSYCCQGYLATILVPAGSGCRHCTIDFALVNQCYLLIRGYICKYRPRFTGGIEVPRRPDPSQRGYIIV